MPLPSGLVDTDMHPTLSMGGKNQGAYWPPLPVSSLFPYLDSTWRRQLRDRSDLPFVQVNVGRATRFMDAILKKDATPPNGGPPGSDPTYFGPDHFDRHGIEAGILLPFDSQRVDSWTNPEEAAAVSAAFNDLMLDTWLPIDRRFHIAMGVSPHDPQLAAKEIRRFGPTPRVVSIWVPMLGQLLGHRSLFPIYEAAEEQGLAICVHPNGTEGDYVGGASFAVASPPSFAERYSLLAELAMSNLSSLIFEGVFERFPRLKVVFTEYGWTWVASSLWRLDATWKAARKSAPWVKRSPTEYVLDHVRFTTEPALEIPTEREALQVLSMMHAERILMFSSDYPHWDGDEPKSVFKSAPDDLKARIFRENAVETFGDRLQLSSTAA